MGKTTLIKELIETKRRFNSALNVYHIDTKKRGDFTTRDGPVILSERAPEVFKDEGQTMVWQPIADDKEEYSRFFLSILNAGKAAIVNIDESINMRFGHDIPRGLSILLVQGRLPGIHVIGGTQEVARAPRQLLSQAMHIISFNVINKYDEHEMLRQLRLAHDKKSLGLKKYEFFYIRPDVDEKARFFKSYHDLLPHLH